MMMYLVHNPRSLVELTLEGGEHVRLESGATEYLSLSAGAKLQALLPGLEYTMVEVKEPKSEPKKAEVKAKEPKKLTKKDEKRGKK